MSKSPSLYNRVVSQRLCRKAARSQGETALALLEKAWKEDPADIRTLLATARVKREQGQQDEALGVLNRAIKKDGTNPAAHLLKGEILFSQKKWAEAQKTFEQTVELAPRNVIAKNFLAFCFLEQGQVERFRKLLSEESLWHRADLIRIAWTQNKLPILKLHEEATGRAMSSSEKSLHKNAATLRAAKSFAKKMLKKGDAKLAWEALSPFADGMGKDTGSAMLFAEASMRAGNPEKARALLERILTKTKDPDDPFLFFLLGHLSYQMGDCDASVDYYRKGIPHATMPYYSAMFEYYCAISLLADGRKKQAGEAIETACKTDSLLASMIALSLTELFVKGRPLKELIDEE